MTDYDLLAAQLHALTCDERLPMPNLANASALIMGALPALNWAGFYLMVSGELVLGPFQGKPACIRIALGRGVCGTAALERRTLRVPDVHAFPGHIACDGDSNAEIVVPIMANGQVVGVLDVDSPAFDRFDEADQAGLERLVHVLEQACEWF